MSFLADLCELALWQVSECTSRSNDRKQVGANFRYWPKANLTAKHCLGGYTRSDTNLLSVPRTGSYGLDCNNSRWLNTHLGNCTSWAMPARTA